ncbi:hypothetical protein V6N13_032719 [Hibiscus sabdariffa]
MPKAKAESKILTAQQQQTTGVSESENDVASETFPLLFNQAADRSLLLNYSLFYAILLSLSLSLLLKEVIV